MFSINYRDPRPVYEQIMDEIRRRIITGVYAPDDKLPSVRELAGLLAINPNTIQRAYRELERSGYIYSAAGRGNFVGDRREVDARRQSELLKTLAETVRELRFLGVGAEEIAAYLREGENEGHD